MFSYCNYRPDAVQLVDHLGDIKSGSSVCSDDYFEGIRIQFDRFADPLLIQADMFDQTVSNPQFADFSGFQTIVREIAKRSAAFGKPVYLFNGDSHIFNSDAPLAPGSRWLNFYDVPTPAPNLTRITVDGSIGVDNYLRVSVNPSGPQVLTWAKVPLTAL